MNKQAPLTSDSLWLDAIKAILDQNHTALQKHLTTYPHLTTSVDARGNTLMHYAVAKANFLAIALLMRTDGKSVTVANHYGQTAADWLKKLITSTYHVKNISTISQLSVIIEDGDVEEIHIGFLVLNISPEIRCIADGVIQQPLHLAIRHQQWDVVNMLLNLSLTTKTLDSKDSTGQTPMLLIEKYLGNPRASSAKGRMQELAAATTQWSPVGQPGNPIPSLRPRDYEQHLSELSAAFCAGIKEGYDCQQLRHTLPTFLYLVYSAYQQALQQPTTTLRRDLKRELLQKLFGGSNAEVYLQRKIKASAEHLEYILKHDLADQLIELSSEYLHMAETKNDRNKITGGTIFLNLTKMDSIQMLVEIGIHEVAHLTEWDKDSAYYKIGPQDTNWRAFDLNPCVKVVKDPESSMLSSDEKVVLDLWYQLENLEQKTNQLPSLTRGQHYALLNPDSTVMYVLTSAAFTVKGSTCWINLADNYLYLRAGFLPEVSDSASTCASYPPELRHPPSNMSGLLQEMAAMRPLSDNSGSRSVSKQEYEHDTAQNPIMLQSSSTPSLNE